MNYFTTVLPTEAAFAGEAHIHSFATEEVNVQADLDSASGGSVVCVIA